MLYILIFTAILIIAAAISDYLITVKNIRNNSSDNHYRQLIIIPAADNAEDIEGVLRNALEMAEYSEYNCRCVISDIGADEETMAICRKFAQNYSIFEICRTEDVSLSDLFYR